MYRIKECVDEFEYKFKDSETGKIKKFKITEKRIVTFNPKLAKKQIYEINKEVGKAKLLKASQAKRSEYGDSAKYVIFTTTDKKGNNTNGKIKVTMNEDLIKKTGGWPPVLDYVFTYSGSRPSYMILNSP